MINGIESQTPVFHNTHSNVNLGSVGNMQDFFGHITRGTIPRIPSFDTPIYLYTSLFSSSQSHKLCLSVILVMYDINRKKQRKRKKTEEGKQQKDAAEASVTYSLQTSGSVSFKHCQTFEEAPLFSAYKSPPYSLHQKEYTTSYTHVLYQDIHTVCTHLSRLQKCWQILSDRQAGRSERGE